MTQAIKVSHGTIVKIDNHTGVDDGVLYLEAIAADETVDVDGEIFDYSSSKPNVEEWSQDAEETTKSSGQEVSYGNVRAQHGSTGAASAAGCVSDPIVFDDKKKQIRTVIKVVDPDAINKVREGIYKGVSFRGPVVGRKWKDGKTNAWRYTLGIPYEISLVDLPANPNAKITVVKASGEEEIVSQEQISKAAAKTKSVGGKELTAKSFAYVGDPDKTATWKLPIHDEPHVRNALARYDQTKGIPAEDKPRVKKRILAAAKRFDIDVSSLDAAAKSSGLMATGYGMGMDAVGLLANLLQQLFYLHDTNLLEAQIEGDESDIPDRLQSFLQTGAEILEDMTSEEVQELMQAMDDKAIKAAGAPDEEKAAAKAASDKEASDKAAEAKKKKDDEEKEAKKGGSFAVAKAAHDSMGDCLNGKCDHKGVAKCAEAIKDAHEKMTKHFDSSPADGEAAKKEESEKAAGSSQVAELTKRIDKLTELVEKGASASAGSGARPHISGVAVTKTADQGGATEDVIEKMSKVDPKSPNAFDERYAIQRAGELEKM